MCVGGVIMALREDVRAVAAAAVIVPLMVVIIGLVDLPAVPLFRSMQVQDRPHQPGAARADHRRPRDPRVRPRAGDEERRFDEANADLTATALRGEPDLRAHVARP